jgi:hypothetical protein
LKHDDGESQEGQKIKRELNKGYQHRNRKEGQRKLHVLQNLVIQKFKKKEKEGRRGKRESYVLPKACYKELRKIGRKEK